MKKILLLVLIVSAYAAAWGDPHRDAANCRLSSVLSQACWNNCMLCHENVDPLAPMDIYVKGDVQICAQCHPEQSVPAAAGTSLLRFVKGGGGNHPVAILYSPEDSKSVLITSPSGPKLFTDEWGNNPKIYCSTCHDSMSSSVKLLRVDNHGSALCLSCHRK